MFLPYSRHEIDSEFTHVLHFSFFILQTNGGFFIREAEATKFLFSKEIYSNVEAGYFKSGCLYNGDFIMRSSDHH